MENSIIAKSRAEQSRAEQSRAEQSRNPYIQIIRALAIFAVVCIHTCPIGISQVLVRPFINFGVGVFLFLSGYLTRETTWDIHRMWKRIKRVLIPYIIWTCIYSLGSPKAFLYNLATASSSAQMYYVLVYIQLVLLTYICFKGLKNRTWLLLLICISPLSFIFKYLQIFGDVQVPAITNTIYGICFLPWICYYVIGLWLRANNRDFQIRLIVLLWIASILLQLFEGYIWFRARDTNCGTQMKVSSWITTTLTCLFFFEVIRQQKNVNREHNVVAKALILIGDYSFGIYLCHVAVIMVLGKIPMYSRIPYGLNSLLVLLLSLAFCYIGNAILRNIHLGEWNMGQVLGLK